MYSAQDMENWENILYSLVLWSTSPGLIFCASSHAKYAPYLGTSKEHQTRGKQGTRENTGSHWSSIMPKKRQEAWEGLYSQLGNEEGIKSIWKTDFFISILEFYTVYCALGWYFLRTICSVNLYIFKKMSFLVLNRVMVQNGRRTLEISQFALPVCHYFNRRLSIILSCKFWFYGCFTGLVAKGKRNTRL